MPLTPKRVLTDETRESAIALDNPLHSSTPPDVTASLRGIGSRIRKSVTEGYITHNSSYVKPHSTGTIFRSANDTLRDIFPSGPHAITALPSNLKRTYEQSEGYDSDGGAADSDTEMHSTTPNTVQVLKIGTGFSRPTKALRKPRRTMLLTRSLPGGSLGFANPAANFISKGSLEELEEEDWSISASQPQLSSNVPAALDSQSLSGTEPMILI